MKSHFFTKVHQTVMLDALKLSTTMRFPMTISALFVVFLAVLLSPARGADDADTNMITWATLPAACKEAVKKYSDDVELLYLEKGEKFGLPVYEVNAKIEGVFTSLTMSADGRFILIEEYSIMKKLPTPVVKRLIEAEKDSKVGVRAKLQVSYTYLIEFEDERPPIAVDATGTPILANQKEGRQ